MSAKETLVRLPQAEDLQEWTRMRAALWPASSQETHTEEIAAFLTGKLTGRLAGLHAVAAFVAVRPAGGLCGFVEASIRPMADGCTTHPVGYIKGWYVDPEVRHKGIGRRLIAAAETWAWSQGCREMASAADLTNLASMAAHKALGFNEEAKGGRKRQIVLIQGCERSAFSSPGHGTRIARSLLPIYEKRVARSRFPV